MVGEDGVGVVEGISDVEMVGIDVLVAWDAGVGVGVNVVVTTWVVGSMSIIDIVRVVGSLETVTVSVMGGEDSMIVVGAEVTVTVRVVSASLPCPPLPSIGTTEYVGRAGRASAAGVLFHRKGKAEGELHREEIATSRERGRLLRCILLG